MKNTTYYKIASHEATEVKKCLLLYSGGLDTSVMLKWIQDEYNCPVVALTLDLGQQADNLEEVKQKALDLGAEAAVVADCKDEFADEYIAKGIKANVDYQGGYHLSTPLGRPLIAKKAVEVAKQYGCDTIAHGCTGKGNDQVRIEAGVLCHDPEMKIIAPIREWSMGRTEEIEYAEKNNIPISHSKEKPYSYDDNMWGVSAEGGEIENPTLIPDLKNILAVNKTLEEASNEKEEVTLKFKEGLPIALNGKEMKLSELILKLNDIGSKHGIGSVIHIEDRLVGLKIRDIYEHPGAKIIVKAHQKLENIVSTQDENKMKSTIDKEWAYLCYNAKWTEPTMDHLNAFIDSMNKKVEGTVTIHLYKGNVTIVAVDSPYSLFNYNLATFEKNLSYNQNASPGFIEIYSLAMKTSKQVEKGGNKITTH